MKKVNKKCQFCRWCQKNKNMVCKSTLSPNYGQSMYQDETCEVWSGIYKHKKDKGAIKVIPKDIWDAVEKSLKK